MPKPMTLILSSGLQSFPSAYRLRSFLMIFRSAALVLLAAFLTSVSVSAQTSILTQHYDTGRTGQNTAETVLNPTNVNSTTFGKLFPLTVDDHVSRQPLYLPYLAIPGNGTHNVLYVAPEHDSLYAFAAAAGSQ